MSSVGLEVTIKHEYEKGQEAGERFERVMTGLFKVSKIERIKKVEKPKKGKD
jgi:hypothetical protein